MAMRFLGMARCDFLLSRLVMISFGRDSLLSRFLGMARCDFLLSFQVMISFGLDCLLSRSRGMIHVGVSRIILGKLSLPNTTGSPFGGVVGSRTILRKPSLPNTAVYKREHGIIGSYNTKISSSIACDAFRTQHPMRLRRMAGNECLPEHALRHCSVSTLLPS